MPKNQLTAAAAPVALLMFGLLSQLSLALAYNVRPLAGDEFYYVERAWYVAENRALPRADLEQRRIHAGLQWGTTDWRPQGYPLFLLVLSGGRPMAIDALRLRATLVQFSLLASVAGALYGAVAISTRGRGVRWSTAALLGFAPWSFQHVSDLLPEALNAFLVAIALLMLWRWASAPHRGSASLVGGALTASATLHFRPEMIAMAPLIIGAAFGLRLCRSRVRWRDVIAAVAAFGIALALQVAYRIHFIDRVEIFGPFRITNGGAFEWTRTWLGTEKEAYDFVYIVSQGGLPPPLPDRAYHDDFERTVIARAVKLAHERGYSAHVDGLFARLAEKRRREHRLLVVGVRALNVIQVWLNLEMSPTLLDALAGWTRGTRRPLLGLLLVLKILIVVAGVCCGVQRLLRRPTRTRDPYDNLVKILFAYVAARTLFVALVLDWRVARYVSSAWLPMLVCAAGLAQIIESRRSGDRARIARRCSRLQPAPVHAGGEDRSLRPASLAKPQCEKRHCRHGEEEGEEIECRHDRDVGRCHRDQSAGA